MVVHPAAGNWSGTLLNGLLAHCPELGQIPRAGIVHRLDKETSGLMVVAKTLPAQKFFGTAASGTDGETDLSRCGQRDSAFLTVKSKH